MRHLMPFPGALLLLALLGVAEAGVAEDSRCLQQQAAFIANLTIEVQTAAGEACNATSCQEAAASVGSETLFTTAAWGLQSVLGACGSNDSYTATTVKLRPINVLAMDADYAVGLAQGYKANTGWSVDINVKYGNSDLDTYLTQLQQGNGTEIVQYDGFIFRTDRLAAMAAAGILLPLEDILATDAGKAFKWQDIYLNLRQSTARYGGKVVAVPLGIWPFMMYVRRDWMAEGQKLLGEPTSWGADNMLTHEGVLRIAEALQRRNYDFSVAPNGYRNDTFTPNKRPICFHTNYAFFDSSSNPPITHTAFLMHLLGTFTQTAGPSQGWLLDQQTAEPFVNTAAMRAALRLWLRYMAVSVIQPDDVAGAMSCAVIFSSMEVFKNLTSYDTYVRGQLQFMAMPGSTTFYNRNTRTLQRCGASTCSSSTELVRDRNTVYYNMVGGSATRRAYLLGINKLSTPAYQLQMWDFATYLSLSTYELSWYRNLDVNAIRASELTNRAAYTSDPNQPNWTGGEWEQFRYGCELTILDYPNYMEDARTISNTALMTSLQNYANQLYEAVATSTQRLNGSDDNTTTRRLLHGSWDQGGGAMMQHRELLGAVGRHPRERKLFLVYPTTQMPDGVVATAHDGLIDATMTGLYQDFMTNINASGGIGAIQADNWQALNYDPPKPPPVGSPRELTPPPPPPPSASSDSNWFNSLSESQQVAIIATPTAVGVTLLILALIAIITTRRSQHKGLISGAILAPGAGPDTSLLITDIESSTTFWEVLPSEVMDESIALHHLVMRSCARKHRCYESATEGDSFLLSAHSPADALRCALDVQRALMEAPWPAALLAQPLCQPRYASPLLLPGGVRNLLGFPTGQGLFHNPGGGLSGDGSWLWGMCGGGSKKKNAKGLPYHTPLPPAADPNEDNPGSIQLGVPNTQLFAPSSQPLQSQLALALVRAFVSGVSTSATGPQGRMSDPGGSARRRSLLGLQVSDSGVPARRRSLLGLPGDLMGPAGTVLILRGLRVRMGIHTGVTQSSEVAFNKTAGRMQYSGEFLTLAKLIQDVAQGGQVLATAGCFGQLPKEQMQSEVVLGHMGNHVLKEGYAPAPVYSALNHPVLMLRAGLLGPVRTVKQVSAGIMQAPTGCASICFMYALSVSALMSWNPEVAQQAVATYQQIAQGLLWQMGGYAVEVAEGLILAALGSPTAALHWATATIEACLNADWPAELLDHQLGEEISVTTLAPVGGGNINSSFTLAPGAVLGGGVLVGLAGGDGPSTANVTGGVAVKRSGRKRSGLAGVVEQGGAAGGEEGGGEEEGGEAGSNGATPLAGGAEAGTQFTKTGSGRRGSGGEGGRRPSHVYKPLRLLRGLRLKCGIDLGALSVSLNETTGHMQYKGKVMNRSARIGSVAKTGQVWCSEAVWQAHLDEEDVRARSYQTSSRTTSGDLARLIRTTGTGGPTSGARTVVSGTTNTTALTSSSNTTKTTSTSSAITSLAMSLGIKKPSTTTSTEPAAAAAAAPALGSGEAPAEAGPSPGSSEDVSPGTREGVGAGPSTPGAREGVGAGQGSGMLSPAVGGSRGPSPPGSGDPAMERSPDCEVSIEIGSADPTPAETAAPATAPPAAPAAADAGKPAPVVPGGQTVRPPPGLQLAGAASGGEPLGGAGTGDWYGLNCGPNGEDVVLAGVPLGPHKLKGIVDEMHLVQVRRLVLDSM